jgi:hypothetical protein
MLDEIACRCEATGCDRELDDGSCQLVFRTPGGERRAMLDRLDQAGIAWFTEPVGRTPGE